MNNQAALFSFDDIDDSALLFGAEIIRKRYTAEQVHGLDCKRNAILMLLASDWPVETIARQLHVNLRTVIALAKRSGEEVAGFKKEFASMLMRTGGRWLGLARAKEDTASFKDLTIGAGIVMQHARELHMMGEGAEEKVLKEDQDHAQAAAALRALMAQPARPGEGSPDSNSGGKGRVNEGIEGRNGSGAGEGVGGLEADRAGETIEGGRGGVRSGPGRSTG